MKSILPFIVSENQSTFVPDWQITDNVLIASEILNFLHHKTKGKKDFMSIKLDMSQAYDRVEWSFLVVVMRRMGFTEKWVSLMKMCISTVSYSVLVNGFLMELLFLLRPTSRGSSIPLSLSILCRRIGCFIEEGCT